ncbi:hypothetical protein CEXT_281811 [Caerostris extrusa]|uniref:Uncharacterized protein n=1 Tax=Caerostris extrusa TaxID=172846 RepID=A0AAV4UZ02_CAEEX|nr:hypothetical protein CEXT_281811 [Caerostris extrusa]
MHENKWLKVDQKNHHRIIKLYTYMSCKVVQPQTWQRKDISPKKEFRLLCSSTETRPGDYTTRKDFAQKILSNRSKAIVVRVPVCVINGSSLPFSPQGFLPHTIASE